jgi:Raf kinase inhibitor-like YbhB/YbcL family protein
MSSSFAPIGRRSGGYLRCAPLIGVFLAAALAPSAAGQQILGRSGAMNLASSAFSHNGAIPKKHTCDGSDSSPPLSWSGVPTQAKSLVLIVDDPDAPDPAAPKMTWVHWVLYNLPPSAGGLAEGVTSLPAGTAEGTNDWQRTGYGGPCPPVGRHRYFHKLYALDTLVQGLSRPNKAAIERAMQGHIIARAELIGTYER